MEKNLSMRLQVLVGLAMSIYGNLLAFALSDEDKF